VPKFVRLLTPVLALSLILLSANTAFAQYKRVDLVSNISGAALNTDPNLINGWGLAFFTHSPFWVSDAGTGVSTLYGPGGSIVPLVVTVPSAAGGNVPGSPSGIVANSSTGFVVSENGTSGPSAFIFDTLDGTISGWNPNVDLTHAIIAVNNSSSGAFYTGLAIGNDSSGNTFIYAADQANNKVDVYDSGFSWVKSFTDSSLPAGYAAFGIQNIGGKLYVTFAGFFSGNPGGFVDVFDTSGNFIKNFAANGTLSGPWGLAQAPANFGGFSHDILVGNLFDGTINAFRRDGKFKGQLKDVHGGVIAIDGLWALKFGTDPAVNGAKNQLFFTSGPSFYANGLFGQITAIEDDQGED
jgi:uncharacterized protein (TIGR03118 family)